MSIDTVNTLVDALRYERLLGPGHLSQLTEEILAGFDSPRSLAKHLVQLGWLTVYQINHLFEGHSQDLVIGPYCILDRLGEGGVGQVFKAWDNERHRLVALKVLRDDLSCERDAIRQFEREREAVTRLHHPNIVRTFDTGQAEKRHYFAMEFIEGTDLGKVVQLSGPLPVGDACDYIRQVAAGLQHAHQVGLVHRDIKPANLFVVTPGHDVLTPGTTWKRPVEPVVKILDWGLARLQQDEGQPGETACPCAEEGMLIGTADYIAPEQSRNPRLVDIRADIYSLGCTFFYLLTGQPPFPGTSLMQKIMQHQNAEPPAIQSIRPEVPAELAQILEKMLAKQPEARYQIPLAISIPLRRFCQVGGAGSFHGTVTRNQATGSGNGSGVFTRPAANPPSGNRPNPGSMGSLRRNP